jgi:hypothetical protein
VPRGAALEHRELGLHAVELLLHLLVGVLRFVAALVNEEGREDDEGEQLQELRLPVLQGRVGPAPEVTIAAEGVRCLSVGGLLGAELTPPGDGLEYPARQKQQRQDNAEAVIVQDPSHAETRSKARAITTAAPDTARVGHIMA